MLVHDFGGCEVSDVLAALGLTFDALYPEQAVRGQHCHEKMRGEIADDTAWSPIQVLRCCADDLLYAAVLTSDVVDGRARPDVASDALFEIAGRLAAAVSLTQLPRRYRSGERRTRG